MVVRCARATSSCSAAASGEIDRSRLGTAIAARGFAERLRAQQRPRQRLSDSTPERARGAAQGVRRAHRAGRAAALPRPGARRARRARPPERRAGFSAEDERLLTAFATQRRDGGGDRARRRGRGAAAQLEAAERERSRWARELHDQTLQDLGAPEGACCPPRAARSARAARRASSSRRSSSVQLGVDRAARPDHRAAPGGAGRARHRVPRCDALVDRTRRRRARDRARRRPGLRERAGGHAPRPRAGEHRLPARAGGADQRRQARRRQPRDGRA